MGTLAIPAKNGVYSAKSSKRLLRVWRAMNKLFPYIASGPVFPKPHALRVTVSAFIEKDGRGYRGYCPTFRGLHVDGRTRQQVRRRLQKAADVYVASLAAHGEIVRPAIRLTGVSLDQLSTRAGRKAARKILSHNADKLRNSVRSGEPAPKDWVTLAPRNPSGTVGKSRRDSGAQLTPSRRRER